LKKAINTDKKIWKDFKEGQEDALAYIYNHYVQLLFLYGRRFSSDREFIKDTIQDLFYDLIRTRENLGDVDNIKFYLIVSFRRKLLQNLKKNVTTGNVTVENLAADTSSDSSEADMIREEEKRLRKEMLEEGLKKLNPRQQEILFYRFTCGFDYPQICEIMSLKYDSARKLHFRALKMLRQHIQKTKTKPV